MSVVLVILSAILDGLKVPMSVEIFCLVNMINANVNKTYVGGKQALLYSQSVILPIRLFCLAVNNVGQPATYS